MLDVVPFARSPAAAAAVENEQLGRWVPHAGVSMTFFETEKFQRAFFFLGFVLFCAASEALTELSEGKSIQQLRFVLKCYQCTLSSTDNTIVTDEQPISFLHKHRGENDDKGFTRTGQIVHMRRSE